MNSIGIYIQQRFKLKVYLPLCILLSLLGMQQYEVSTFEWNHLFSLMVIVPISLFFFRLFDDLVSRKEDDNLTNRIYTDPKNFVTLIVFLICVFLGGSLTTFVLFKDHFYWYLGMIGLSLTPYVFRLILPQFNFIYPLFKYGLIVLFMNAIHGELTLFDFVFAGVVVLGFIQYEILEDDRLIRLRKHVVWLYWCLVIPFVILFPNAWIWILISSIIPFGFWVMKKLNYMHYCILLLILSLKIIVYVV